MSYYFKGDLCQLEVQRKLLIDYGYEVKMSNVYPTVETEEEFLKAISLIYTMKCDGWWHYKEMYFKHNICTEYVFWKSLGKDRVVKLYHFVNRKDIWDGIVKLNGMSVKDEDAVVKLGDIIAVGDKEIIVK